jgi:hypothetical protein
MAKKTHDSAEARRYSARLLFQFRVVIQGNAAKRRLCEERIITFAAAHARAALREAKKRGRAACYNYKNSNGCPVHFEFVGVLELLCLGPECNTDEVWYHIVERVTPMERRAILIPPEEKLNAIRFND